MAAPKGVTIDQGEGGLERIRIDRPEARGEIYTHGATVTGWQPKGREPVLFVSRSALYRSDKAIRGGIPICFPWFGAKAGDDKAPQHGFARVCEWKVSGFSDDPSSGVTVELLLASNDATLAEWPHRFEARYRVSFGAKLEVELEVSNVGETPFTFEEALHTYFVVKDVRAIRIAGLEGTEYIDKIDGGARKRQAELIAIDRENDRLYLDNPAACEVRDLSMNRKISVIKDGSRSTVVWNPWIEKARALKDFGDDEYEKMICVESANASSNAIALDPHGRHAMRVRIVVNDL
jgi:glucose-6-phosphate 1-epimerase